jgi:hypothetical protein
MAKGKTENYIEIPEESLRVKALFPDRPTDEVVSEIKQWIRDGKPAYLNPYHTHTQPPPGARILYRGEFDLPEKDFKAGRLAPCPCCTPHHPKYGKNGKIAWFPDEAVIRLLGPDCYRALDSEGHDKAIEEFRKEEKQRKRFLFLLGNEAVLRGTLDALRTGKALAEALDQFGRDFRKKAYDTMALDLWPHFRRGQLQLNQKRSEFTQWGGGATKEVDVIVDYAKLGGFRLLDPEAKSLATAFTQPLQAFQVLDEVEDWRAFVVAKTEDERTQLASLLDKGRQAGKVALDNVAATKKLLAHETLATLRAWGRHPDCPYAFHLDFDATKVVVGRSSYTTVSAKIPEILNAYDSVPTISLKALKAA